MPRNASAGKSRKPPNKVEGDRHGHAEHLALGSLHSQPQRARAQACRVASSISFAARPWRLLWAGGLATVSVAALALVLWVKQPALENHHAPVLEDMDLVLSAENVELAEDLEFYHWLAGDDVTG